jgi:hypothetical protein
VEKRRFLITKTEREELRNGQVNGCPLAAVVGSFRLEREERRERR